MMEIVPMVRHGPTKILNHPQGDHFNNRHQSPAQAQLAREPLRPNMVNHHLAPKPQLVADLKPLLDKISVLEEQMLTPNQELGHKLKGPC